MAAKRTGGARPAFPGGDQVGPGPATGLAQSNAGGAGGAGDAHGGQDEAHRRAPAGLRHWLPYLGFGIAAWAALPRFVSPPFHTANANEVADHLVPAVVVLAVSLCALVLSRRGGRSELAMLVAGMVILLAGLWMAATHAPLLTQALRHQAPWAATIHHVAAAVAVFVFGATWTTLWWNGPGAP